MSCRTRRVKCGEEKPHCLRCQKFGVECEGYTSHFRTRQPGQSEPVTVKSAPLASILPLTAIFDNQAEYLYFLHFRDETSLDLSGTTWQPIWDSVILRTCNSSMAIRHLAMSVAAISKARDFPSTTNEHHVFAGQFYGKGLRELQITIASKPREEGMRIALIASTLIFCYENLQGEFKGAIVHMKSALIMMRQRLSTCKRKYSIMQRYSSIPNFEDELLEVFVRADKNFMVRMDDSPAAGVSILDIAHPVEEFYMPHAFRDLREAKNFLEHFSFVAMPLLARLPHTFMYESATEFEFDGAQLKLFQQFRQWQVAFAPLFAATLLEPASMNFITAATIRILALTIEMSVQKLITNSNADDFCEKETLEVLHLAERITTDPRFKRTFVYDCGLVPGLFIVVVLSRNQGLRRDAIRILRSAKGRVEVTWDAGSTADMVEAMMAAELKSQEAASSSIDSQQDI